MNRNALLEAVRGLGVWFVGSLLAVLILEYNALLGLAIALAFGILLGVLLFRGHPSA